MITVIARIKTKQGSESVFASEAQKVIDFVKANEPETLMYILSRSIDDPTVFVFFESYSSAEAMTAHGASEAMKQFGSAIRRILDGRPQIEKYEDLGGKR